MKIFFSSDTTNKDKKSKGLPADAFIIGYILAGVISLFILGYLKFEDRFSKPVIFAPQPAQEPSIVVGSIESVVDSIASSYGVPVGPMIRFAGYLKDNQFNEKYGGVGLFCVKPSHLDWIKDNVLRETVTDLEDNLQNTQAASFLLKRFKDAGYSWVEAFLIYAYGFPAIHETDKHQDFIKAVFSDGG